LLDHVRQFVREELAASRLTRRELAAGKNDVRTDGIGPRGDGLRGTMRRRVVMHANLRKILAKAALEKGSRRQIECTPGRRHDLVDDRRHVDAAVTF
jgi:hypothetical protein